MKRECKLGEVKAGEMFTCELMEEGKPEQFIKLADRGKFNIVNVAAWTPARLDSTTVVKVVGAVEVKEYK